MIFWQCLFSESNFYGLVFIFFILFFLSFSRCFYHFNISPCSSALTFNDLVWEWNVVANDDLNSVMILLVSERRVKSEEQRALWNAHRTSMFIAHRHRIFCKRTKIYSASEITYKVWKTFIHFSVQTAIIHSDTSHFTWNLPRNITKLRPITANNIFFFAVVVAICFSSV